MKEGWKNLLSDERWFGVIVEMYRRAVVQHGYKFLQPLVTEARTNNDGYTTLALITLGKGWVNGYGIAVKGPKDQWNSEEGICQALRKAFDNAVIILKQKENHDRILLTQALQLRTQQEIDRIKKLTPKQVEEEILRVSSTQLE